MRPIVPYVGGKYRYGKKLDALGLLPKEIDNYYEPFCGGAGMFCYLSNTRNLNKFYLNDLDSMLINMYQQIQENDIDVFLSLFNSLELSNDVFLKCVEMLDTNYSNDIFCAVAYFYIKRTCYGGIIKYRTNGLLKANFYEMGISLRDIEKTVFDFKTVITSKDVTFTNVTFSDIVIDNKENTFVFLDPPYLCKEAFYIHDNQIIKELLSFCNDLHRKGIRWCFTYNTSDTIQKYFSMYNILSLKFNSLSISKINKTGKRLDELIVTNYHPNTFKLLEQN
jgi:DNA adenine methylase Dam